MANQFILRHGSLVLRTEHWVARTRCVLYFIYVLMVYRIYFEQFNAHRFVFDWILLCWMSIYVSVQQIQVKTCGLPYRIHTLHPIMDCNFWRVIYLHQTTSIYNSNYMLQKTATQHLQFSDEKCLMIVCHSRSFAHALFISVLSKSIDF